MMLPNCYTNPTTHHGAGENGTRTTRGGTVQLSALRIKNQAAGMKAKQRSIDTGGGGWHVINYNPMPTHFPRIKGRLKPPALIKGHMKKQKPLAA
jgi:hypothetical protein